MALVYKITQDGQKDIMFEMARSNNQRARTIQTTVHHGLAVQYARTDIRKHSFTVRVVVKWNRLPDSGSVEQGILQAGIETEKIIMG